MLLQQKKLWGKCEPFSKMHSRCMAWSWMQQCHLNLGKTDYFYPINKISFFSMGNLWVTCGKKSRLHQYLTFWASTKWGCECCEGGTSQCFSAHQPHQSENSRRWTSLRVRLDHMLYFIHLQWIAFREGTHRFELGRATSGRSGRCKVGHQERVYPFALGIYWAFFVFFSGK